MRRIGIDVGGTNTDAVLLENGRVVHAVKTPTTEDVMAGILTALAELAGHPDVARGAIDGVVIGTTHFVNAVVQRRDLAQVAAVRIGLPASASLPPFCDWPEDLAQCVRGEVFMLEGGHDYDGRPIVPFDETGMRKSVRTPPTSTTELASRGNPRRSWPISVEVPPTSMTIASASPDRKAAPRIELVAPEAKLITGSAVATSADITVPSFWVI